MAILGLAAHQTSTTTGTGAYSLDGDVADMLTLVEAAAIESGDNAGPWEVEYVARSGADIENAVGTLTAGSPATLSRDTIIRSTNGGAAINWGGGARDIFLAPGATTLSLLSEATSAATPNMLARRDANGRMKAAAPAASDDVARKTETDAASAAATAASGAAGAAQSTATAAQNAINTHAALTDNPHAVTKAQVGLGSVLNQAQAFFAAASIASPGYLRLTNGTDELIVQWGKQNMALGALTTVALPLTFPTAPLAVYVSGSATGTSGSNNIYAAPSGTTGITLRNWSDAQDVYWLAIGH